jgi:signal transduction histidine kinase
MTLLPKSLAGQLLLLLLGGIFAAHGLGIVLFYLDSPNALQLAARNQITDRVASGVRVAETAPKAALGDLMRAMSSPNETFEVTSEGDEQVAMDRQEAQIAQDLQRKLSPNDHQVSVKFGERIRGVRPEQGAPSLAFSISTRLQDGTLLRYMRTKIEPPKWWRDLPFSIAVSTLPVLIVTTLLVGWITRPVRALARAAEQVGRGERTDPLPITGPREVQETTAAFNAMQDRLLRFVRDRTRMLAAISHDFRTPITSLRLRAEMVEDEEIRSAMTRTLDEMRDMVQATLTFASESAADEETRMVDLVSLVEAVADDELTLGHRVEVDSPDRLPYRCRPTSLKRAIVNLTENAIRYGERVRLTLTTGVNSIRIRIEDDGPGIPQEKLEEVFEPFTRLELSRSPDTGGVGLGLAVARSCVRAHGGDVILSNMAEHGLRAEIILPA